MGIYWNFKDFIKNSSENSKLQVLDSGVQYGRDLERQNFARNILHGASISIAGDHRLRLFLFF